MKIVQITPGSGDNFYCENCLRDAALVKAMRKLGEDVLMIPMYLPIQSDKDEKLSSSPIFFGGINVYLQQKIRLFRRTPRWIDKIFDNAKLLEWVGRKSDMTTAKELGETTISMLMGEHGKQTKELERLVGWLAEQENKPDIICISNVLLVGLVKRMKEALSVPIVCLLQGEDDFLDNLTEPYARQAWQIASERAKDVDAFISVSDYYASVMRERLKLSEQRVYTIHIGISIEDYEPIDSLPAKPTIGYLSRMCHDKGLDFLVDAFIKLKKKETLSDAKLSIAGSKPSSEREFISGLEQRLESSGFREDIRFWSDFDFNSRRPFFSEISVLAVPERKPVAYALYVLEALASGVPVIEPAVGAIPELLNITGGGILYEPNDLDELVDALERLLADKDYASKLAKQGREAVLKYFNIEQNARKTISLYEELVRQYIRG
jgi:glycosyltransferase involved in cell wall biosynthesis